jgi:hypothetical protein
MSAPWSATLSASADTMPRLRRKSLWGEAASKHSFSQTIYPGHFVQTFVAHFVESARFWLLPTKWLDNVRHKASGLG